MQIQEQGGDILVGPHLFKPFAIRRYYNLFSIRHLLLRDAQ
jgi:hypothetical protein